MRALPIRTVIIWPMVILCLMVWICFKAGAQECDCNRHIGVCQATGSLDLQREKLSIRANTDQCAQVIYYVDEQPGSMTITGGFGATDFFRTNNRNHVLSVDSCSICAAMETLADRVKRTESTAALCHQWYPDCTVDNTSTEDNAALVCSVLLRGCLRSCNRYAVEKGLPSGSCR